MLLESQKHGTIFREGWTKKRPCRAAVASVCFAASCALALSHGLHWSLVTAIGVAGLIVIGLLWGVSGTELELTKTGFRFQVAEETTRSVEFSEIDQCYFEDVLLPGPDVRTALFWVQLRDGQKLNIPFKVLSMKSVAQLFSEFDRHKVSIVEPFERSAVLQYEAIRKAQTKTLGGWTRYNA